MLARISSALEVFDKGSLKGAVVLALAQEWPLSARRLHAKLAQDVSYHAVYKTVNQMVKDGILKKEEVGYLINVEWLESVDSLFKQMHEGYQSGRQVLLPRLKDITQEGEGRTLVFENLEEADAYRKSLQGEYAMSGQIKPYVGLGFHLRSPLLYVEKSINLLSEVAKRRLSVFILCEGGTPLDEWCADYYRMHFLRVRTGVRGTIQSCEIMVMGDHIAQLFVPDRINRRVDEIYRKASVPSDISVPEFYSDICLEKAGASLVITKNSGIAEQIRQNVLSRFATNDICIFSIDGTFLDRMFSVDIIDFLYRNGLLNKEGSVLVKMGEKWKKGVVSWEKLRQAQMKHFPAAIKGKSLDAIESAAKRFFKDKATNYLFKNSAKLISLARSYMQTLAITRLPEDFVRSLEPFFMFDEIIGTVYEVKNGIFTGNVLRDVSQPKERERVFLRWLKDKKGRSFGFGNHYNDLAFLRHVSMPVAVNPDKDLLEHAKANRWKYYDKDSIRDLVEHMRGIFKGGA